jgi:hypothetical protein
VWTSRCSGPGCCSWRRRRGRRRTRVAHPRWSARRWKKKAAAHRCALRGVLLGLARVGKHSGSCSGGWRHVGAFHVNSVRQWGAEERRRRQNESARDGDGVGNLSNLCFSPKTRQGIRTAENGARGGAAWPARGGHEGRWHGAQLQLARSEPTAARSERRLGTRAGENGRWAGSPGGFGLVL